MLNFSGGMQQKIIIARWLLLDPRVLLLDEPTKGVDIGTRSAIYAMLREVAAGARRCSWCRRISRSCSALCSRVVVISDGATIAEMPSAVLDEAKLTLFAAPRSSIERTAALLRALARETGGAAFWALLDGERLFCLNRVGGAAAGRPRLRRRRDAAVRGDAHRGRAARARAQDSSPSRTAREHAAGADAQPSRP